MGRVQYNTTYQRASTPNNTMFYGCVLPDIEQVSNRGIARITAIFEASNLLRNNIVSGEEIIGFGRWEVKKEIHLVTIVYYDDLINTKGVSYELNKAYRENLKNYPDKIENSIIVSEYLASEFAKKDIKTHHDYLISATFTELMTQTEFAGIIYPSVRIEGYCFNVAITPTSVDSCLELVVAGEGTLYKYGKWMYNDMDYVTEVQQNQRQFFMQPIQPPDHLGKDKVYRIYKSENPEGIY
jgi:hypothetical protein